MRMLILIFTLLISNTLFAKPLPTQKNVDVSRYIGKWYAHYSLPQFFTRKCKAQTAEYEIIDSKTISVLNTCIKEEGIETIKGQALVTNPKHNSKLIVTFDSFFTRLFRVKGDYTIIKLDDDYEYVLVGSEDRESLWLMSRSVQEIPKNVKHYYLNYAQSLGFETIELKKSKF